MNEMGTAVFKTVWGGFISLNSFFKSIFIRYKLKFFLDSMYRLDLS